MRDHESSIDGYVRMGCPQCTHEVNYPENNGFVPICPKCSLRMQKFPIEHTVTSGKSVCRNGE